MNLLLLGALGNRLFGAASLLGVVPSRRVLAFIMLVLVLCFCWLMWILVQLCRIVYEDHRENRKDHRQTNKPPRKPFQSSARDLRALRQRRVKLGDVARHANGYVLLFCKLLLRLLNIALDRISNLINAFLNLFRVKSHRSPDAPNAPDHRRRATGVQHETGALPRRSVHPAC